MARFPLGRVLATPGVLAELERAGIAPALLLLRHSNCDDGDLDREDKAANRAALHDGARILSAYQISPDVRVWIITEWDRSVTTLLLPDEY